MLRNKISLFNIAKRLLKPNTFYFSTQDTPEKP